MQITFLNPGNGTDPFYGRTARFMQLAADSLDIDLEILDGNRDPQLITETAQELLSRRSAPEYLLIVNEQGAAQALLPQANAKNTKVLLFNQGLLSVEKAVLGHPRGNLQTWLGELMPDDHQAGHLLALELVAEARHLRLTGGDGRIRILGLGGAYTVSSLLRINGLREAVKDHRDVVLESVSPARWELDRAREVTMASLRQSPEITVVWAASDLMATGALEAIEEVGREAGKDIVVGGIDWAPSAVAKIRQGTLTTSVGGHFMDGAWALIMLHDYAQGYDFAAARALTRFAPLNRDTVDKFSCFFDETAWRNIDFTHLSKAKRADLEHYDFSMEGVRALAQPKLNASELDASLPVVKRLATVSPAAA